jgi:hypothetical protein
MPMTHRVTTIQAFLSMKGVSIPGLKLLSHRDRIQGGVWHRTIQGVEQLKRAYGLVNPWPPCPEPDHVHSLPTGDSDRCA